MRSIFRCVISMICYCRTVYRRSYTILAARPKTRGWILQRFGCYFDDCFALFCKLDTSSLASRGVVHDLFEAIRDRSLFLSIIHPLGSGPISIAHNWSRLACRTSRATLVTFLLAQAAGPAALLTPKWTTHWDTGLASRSIFLTRIRIAICWSRENCLYSN